MAAFDAAGAATSVVAAGGAWAPTPSVWSLPLSQSLGSDAAAVANDVLRMLCIQVAIQLMMMLAGGGGDGDSTPVSLLSADFGLLILYIVLGVMLYWLAVRRLVTFS